MALDMGSILDRAIAEYDQGTREPYVDAAAEARTAVEYYNKKKTERSEGAMQIMAATAGNYKTNYDNTALDRDILRLKNYMAKNLGGYMLTEAIKISFSYKVKRVWVHTCSLDHKNALKNYLSRGMTVFKSEILKKDIAQFI